ncbi:OPA family sugar phosphate sensor protein UhpC-like MFS transporter [Ereboglobus sp. PH5-5]|uniref:MFS transporter n=1 Tax=unclassified Ereboglobus TaxID=2626932 RepID=UPI00240770D5|nr:MULTISPECIES: MFS transporter [unclassified Ereboglobus]MDF9826974.1 OPA family sugar phosphate sensor protein UhpC-like MFS transporter [Ereboglobus sp. PH5-10]MDF9831997.1 OPA family sugar phosphate sensor protein UhpC-like MFS transporter [Ereboglobus sp. PH5-5]
MFKRLLNFFRVSQPAAVQLPHDKNTDALYKRLRWQVFLAGTIGYSLFYVCRTTLNVVKKPMLDAGLVDASQLGVVGSALLFAYAGGKFFNGFIADHSNIKRFMATGLALSACANLVMGVMGFTTGVISAGAFTAIFATMWAISGWGQSVGSPCAVIGLSRWYPLKKRGTFYGFFSLSHNLGEFLSFVLVGLIVSAVGWQWGFWGAALAGVLGVVVIIWLMHDTPESQKLPPVEVLTGEAAQQNASAPAESTASLQRLALRTPGVWILAASSAFMYMARYAVNSWGVLFLQETKDYSLVESTNLISVNALLGIFGTVLSGWFSDKFFRGDRRLPAIIFGVCNTVSLILFLYGGSGIVVNVISMILFGISIGVLICFLGGLMAVDLVPRKATGAAMGVVGLASYIAAGCQDIISGKLIDARITIVEGVKVYDFSHASAFWVIASTLSFLLIVPLLFSKKKPNT